MGTGDAVRAASAHLPPATVGSSGRPTAPSSASPRRRSRATRPSSNSTSGRSTPRSFAFDGDALLVALREITADDVQGEHYLPDALPVLRAHERTVIAHELADPTEVEGINDRIALAELGARAQRRIAERHMPAGVTIVNPASGTSPRATGAAGWSRSVFTPA